MNISAQMRLTIGLACIFVSTLLGAIFLGMIPDRRGAMIEGRRTLGESVAISSSILISRKDIPGIRVLLNKLTARNKSLISAGMRDRNGALIVDTGEHANNWVHLTDERSNDSQIQVPLFEGRKKWGNVELRFTRTVQQGFSGFLSNPVTRLLAFSGSAGFLVVLFYLGKMLQHLDPSQAVPRRVRSALDNLAEGMVVTDDKERIVLANQAFASWVDEEPMRLIGRKISSFDWMMEEEAATTAYPWKTALDELSPIAGESLRLKAGDDAVRSLIVNATPILGQEGKYRGVLVSLDDVTQLEETKRELIQSKVEAEVANEAKSEFLARMSHEIRTPMNAILGYTDVLRRGFDDSVNDRKEYLDTIHGSGEHLLTLINDILDLSKIESGRMELELDRCSPFQIVSQVVSVLRVRADEKEIYLDFQCDGLIPETILSDATRLRQAIMNLVGNAIKFTERGGVRIIARYLNDAKSPKMQFEVIDTGIGISAAAQKTVFDPFSQADNTVTRRFGGTGLGLAISKQLVEAMGGEIHVASEPGQGSSFSFTVDIGGREEINLLTVEQARQIAMEENNVKSERQKLPPARILVADDGVANRKLIHLVLTKAGVTVEMAEDGQQALDMALERPFDVILMDMQMPVMDGYTSTSRLREQGYGFPIIALTAHAMQGAEEKCRQAGCSGFLTKPVDIDSLLDTLAQILDSCHVESVDGRGPECDDDDQLPEHFSDDCFITSAASSAVPFDDKVAADRLELQDQPPVNDPIVSTLPMDDEDFREIVIEFVGRLHEKLDLMKQAYEDGDLVEIASLAHWLKGSGGTVGFDAFTGPARELEQAAKDNQVNEIWNHIQQLLNIANRVAVPSVTGLAR